MGRPVGRPDSHLAFGVESLSSSATALLERPGVVVPRVNALVAGVVAAVNPCGFALLPGYLGLYLRGAGGDGRSIAATSRRAAVFAVAVAASFALLFGVAGLATSLAGRAVSATALGRPARRRRADRGGRTPPRRWRGVRR